jgi:hypothetical protein
MKKKSKRLRYFHTQERDEQTAVAANKNNNKHGMSIFGF